MAAHIARIAAGAALLLLGACAQPLTVIYDASGLEAAPDYAAAYSPPESDLVVPPHLPPRFTPPRPIYVPAPVVVSVPVYVPGPVVVAPPVGGGSWIPVVQ